MDLDSMPVLLEVVDGSRQESPAEASALPSAFHTDAENVAVSAMKLRHLGCDEYKTDRLCGLNLGNVALDPGLSEPGI